MVENAGFIDIKELPITVIGGLILIAAILIVLGLVLLNGDKNDKDKNFLDKLKEKEQKLKDYESQKKRLNLMEVQLKILQLERNKKTFWGFWK